MVKEVLCHFKELYPGEIAGREDKGGGFAKNRGKEEGRRKEGEGD